MSMPEDYRNKFIAQLHNALSGFTGFDVDEAVRFSEQSKSKAIGITIETRPDYCLRPHLRWVLDFKYLYHARNLYTANCSGTVAHVSKLVSNPYMKTLPETQIEDTPFELSQNPSISLKTQVSRSLHTWCLTCLTLVSNEIWNNSRSTSRTPCLGVTVWRSTLHWLSEVLDCTSCGGLGGIRIIHQTCLWMLSQEFWH